MVTVLSAPIRFGGQLQAVVNFFSRQPGWFAREDLPIAERIASHIALAMSNHRLAEEARERQALEAHASKLDLLDQSLASLTATGDLKDLFDRISAVARKVFAPRRARSASVHVGRPPRPSLRHQRSERFRHSRDAGSTARFRARSRLGMRCN